ncbi:MAG: universal stress protein [Candidatus Sumerlaeota bacterium]|nr:universal stress protein [Candidatus Sumerlaeota bacterium]
MQLDKRPRNIGPFRAAAILYGDWGTSKAYTLGIAFALAGYSSFPLLVAMGVLTALVGLNYYWICSHYPDGGGVYSSVRDRSRLIAVIGGLLLMADYIVTASLSVLEGFNYIALMLKTQLGVMLPNPFLWAIGFITFLGAVNWWGPRHSGSMAILLAIPASLAAMALAAFAVPYLREAHFESSGRTFGQNWGVFAGIILALSGVEAVSNMTGIMVPDPQKDPDKPVTVKRTSALAILVVAAEVVGLTIFLAYAMQATPNLDPKSTDAMLGQMAHHFGARTFGEAWGAHFALIVSLPTSLLLLSAGNTAIVGMVSVLYMMASDREMPSGFGKINRHGVPKLPLLVSAALPCLVLMFVHKVEGLAALYAIGVVGAIAINLSASSSNFRLKMNPLARGIMACTAAVMLVIWLTVAVEKHEALVFAVTIIALGLMARSFIFERRQAREERALREMMGVELAPSANGNDKTRILVSLRGVTETLRFAIEEARMRNGRLGILYVREVQVMIPTEANLQEDAEAMTIYAAVKTVAGDVPFDFIYRVSHNAPDMILQVTRESRCDYLILGASAEGALNKLLRGSVVTHIATNLPKETRLLIYSWHTPKPGKSGK